MDEKYRTHLKTLKVVELKAIVKELNKAVHIPVSGVKKADLIEAIVKTSKMLGLKPTIPKAVKTKKTPRAPRKKGESVKIDGVRYNF